MTDLYASLDKLEEYRRNLRVPYSRALTALDKARQLGLSIEVFGNLEQTPKIYQAWKSGSSARVTDAENVSGTLSDVMDGLDRIIQAYASADRDSAKDLRRHVPE